MEGLLKLLEDPMETLYSLAFLFAFIAIIIHYFLRGDKDDKK
jgi:hypothetical protein